MIGKNLIPKRGVMIAVAVIALMTITAGVAAADANRAKFGAAGSVGLVTLEPFASSVGSEFKLGKNDKIKSVTITTVGEVVGGSLDVITKCKERGKKKDHVGTLCSDLATLLTPSAVFSVHGSTAVLKVSKQEHLYAPELGIPIPVITGKLKGNLEGVLSIVGTDAFIGTADLKIKSARGKSHYGCLVGINPLTSDFIWDSISVCQDDPGPNPLSLFIPIPGFGYVIPKVPEPAALADFDPFPAGGPVMIPVELHVTDKGTFEVTGVGSGVELKGKLKVKVDSDPISGTSGTIKVSKGQATFPPAP